MILDASKALDRIIHSSAVSRKYTGRCSEGFILGRMAAGPSADEVDNPQRPEVPRGLPQRLCLGMANGTCVRIMDEIHRKENYPGENKC